jgi:hypothetical protein
MTTRTLVSSHLDEMYTLITTVLSTLSSSTLSTDDTLIKLNTRILPRLLRENQFYHSAVTQLVEQQRVYRDIQILKKDINSIDSSISMFASQLQQ